MRLTRLEMIRPYRNAKRLRRIVAVFARCGWDCLRARRRLRRSVKATGVPGDLSSCLGENLRKAFESLGPTFVKFGQVLSTRRDILPVGIATELAHLQDSVAAIPTEEAIRIVEAEYGCPLTHIFSEFSSVPLGAASLSQVHEARLVSTGESVVVKVQRPGIHAVVETDIDILTRFLPMLERHVEEFRRLNLRSMVEEFYKTILMEMDFHREMYNALKFKIIFEDDPTIRIPSIYKDLCTDKLLVMEKLEGVKIDQLEELVGQLYDRDTLSKYLVAVMAKQIFKHGLFNADVHAGNIIVLPDNVLGLFDFGMVRTIDPETQKLMTDIFAAALTKDAVRISRVLANYAEPGSRVDIMSLARELHELIVFYYDLPMEDLRLDILLETGMNLLARHKLIIPQQLIMLGRTTAMTESIVMMLSPRINFFKELAPYVRQAIRSRFTLSNLGGGLSQFAMDSANTIKTLPAAIGTLMTNLSEDKLSITCRHEELAGHMQQVSRMMAQLVLSIMGGALFLGSALLVAFQREGSSTLRGALGTIGLSVAFVLFMGLILSMLRKK
ncbi:MAG: AarF/UbiB family protein [Kiritimatiellae bacterium]|jgi:ubiquinone biosynthesis protein|nr:AarF/UbiB family protein [Kiritimatiellia bacterium]